MSEFADGFRAGLHEGARTLREAALEHYRDGEAAKKILETQAHQLAGALLSSWANGLDMNAEKSVWSEREKRIEALGRAANELLSVMSEFDDRPELWGEAVAGLQVALENMEAAT